jgi:hypothetical protein
MNERIKELAEQVWGDTSGKPWSASAIAHLKRFAELVAEQTHTNNKAKWYQEGYEAGQRDEREACAKLCEELGIKWHISGEKVCAAAIRGRAE